MWILKTMESICRHTGSPAAEYLPILARSCHLASLHVHGLVEPLYQLHSARAKLACQMLSADTPADAEKLVAMSRWFSHRIARHVIKSMDRRVACQIRFIRLQLLLLILQVGKLCVERVNRKPSMRAHPDVS